jgi:hypothetical protein
MRRQLLVHSLALASVCVQPLMFSLVVAEQICEDKSQYVGGCFSVKGKLFVSNGTPSVRIIAKGQGEQLGVVNDGNIEGRALPDEVAKLISTETRIYGQFEVCPLTEAKPKEIRMVCLISGKNLIARKPH